MDSIRVFLDGALNTDWAYSPTDNTVYFTVIPGPGVLVEIGYLYMPLEDSGTSSDTGDTGA